MRNAEEISGSAGLKISNEISVLRQKCHAINNLAGPGYRGSNPCLPATHSAFGLVRAGRQVFSGISTRLRSPSASLGSSRMASNPCLPATSFQPVSLQTVAVKPRFPESTVDYCVAVRRLLSIVGAMPCRAPDLGLQFESHRG